MPSDDDVYEAIKAIALRDVLKNKGTGAIFRFYSKTFHTPLHVVESLPFEEVLYNVLCENYQKRLETEETSDWLNKEIHDITADAWAQEQETKAKAKAKSKEDAELDLLEQEAIAENIQNEKQAKAEAVEKKIKSHQKQVDSNKLAEKLGLDVAPLPTSDSQEPSLPGPAIAPLNYKFISDLDMETLANMTPEEILTGLTK